MNSEQLNTFYRNEFPVVTIAGKVQKRAIKWIKANLPTGSTIFEFGCSSGPNLVLLEQAGYNVAGCDISERAVKARQVDTIGLGGVHYLKTIPDNHYDLVFTCSVLCHIPDDIQQQLKRIAKHSLFVETTEISDINYFSHEYKGKTVFKIKAPRGIDYRGYYD